jgi:hypothetical protein
VKSTIQRLFSKLERGPEPARIAIERLGNQFHGIQMSKAAELTKDRSNALSERCLVAYAF